MADFSRSSFIPKETSGAVPNRVRRRRTFHVFGFIATAMLIGSLALAAGVYFLKSSAVKSLESAQQSLREQKGLFKQEDISEVREFARRLQAAELLIYNHISPLWIFAELENETMEKVQLTSINIEHTPTLEVLVELKGTTQEFKTLALQEIQLALNSILNNVAFDEVNTDDNEANEADEGDSGAKVVFSLKGTMDPSRILYNGSTHTSNVQVSSGLFQSAVLGETVTSE